MRLKVLNADTATFDCVFPTCGGPCCQDGRPGVEPAEAARIADNMPSIAPMLRPEARREVEKRGFLTHRIKAGKRLLAVVGGWCVFHNEGCTLHRLGVAEGDRFRYKPWRCSTFPLERAEDGAWFIRQWDTRNEPWDLFCLNPAESNVPARTSLGAEEAFAAALVDGAEVWRFAEVDDRDRGGPDDAQERVRA